VRRIWICSTGSAGGVSGTKSAGLDFGLPWRRPENLKNVPCNYNAGYKRTRPKTAISIFPSFFPTLLFFFPLSLFFSTFPFSPPFPFFLRVLCTSSRQYCVHKRTRRKIHLARASISATSPFDGAPEVTVVARTASGLMIARVSCPSSRSGKNNLISLRVKMADADA